MRTTLCALLVSLSSLTAPFAGAPQNRAPLDTEGLYYFDKGWDGDIEIALVITRNGRSIPQKANDPEAPTQPGLYVSEKRFKLRSFSVSLKRVSFRTNEVGGVSYSFDGRVVRAPVDVIENVPSLIGILVKRERGQIAKRQKGQFGLAVVL